MLRIVIQHSAQVTPEDAASCSRVLAQLLVIFGFKGRNEASSIATPSAYKDCVRILQDVADREEIVVTIERQKETQ